MSVNPNLIPTVTVDVNGRTTTVYKKPSVSTKAAALPHPAASSADPIRSIITALRNGPGFSNLTSGPTMINHIREVLRNDPDHEYLKQINLLVGQINSLDDDEVSRGYFRYVLSTIKSDDRSKTKTLLAHSAFNMQHLEGITYFDQLIERLPKDFGITADENGFFATMEAHLKASHHYEPNNASGNVGIQTIYLYNERYVTMVEKYADKIDALIAYRNIYPPTFSDGQDSFDEQHFLEYVEHGALGDGWL